MKNAMRPIHPGEILREELAALGLSANAFAKALAVPTNRITGILNGVRAVTAETALRLSRYLGTSAALWLNLQLDYDLKMAERAHAPRINRDVKPRPGTRSLAA